jgi:hypothetical protein
MRQLSRGWFVLAALMWVGANGACVCAQEGAAPEPDAAAAAAPATQAFGPVGSLSIATIAELASMALLVLAWAGTTDWVSRDSQIFPSINYKKWVPIVVLPFLVLFVALAFIPMPFYVRFPVLAVVYLATIGPYIVVHNKNVLPHQTVMTGSWFRHVFAMMMGKIGVKVSGEQVADYEKGAAVELIAMGAPDANSDNANLLTARQSPGYLLVKDLVADMTTASGTTASPGSAKAETSCSP